MQNGKEILIIENDPNLRTTLALILDRAGYTTTSAQDCTQALQYLVNRKFDLVVVDPETVDPLEMRPSAEIQHYFPNIPLLILAGNASSVTKHTDDRARSGALLLKPAEPRQIIAKVGEILTGVNRPENHSRVVGAL